MAANSRAGEPVNPPRCRALIVPVGGSPEPVRKALETARADFVIFVASPQTAPTVEAILASVAHRPSSWRRLVTPDPQSLEITFRKLAADLPPALSEWGVSWLETLVDLTGGTKVMTAALALATIHHAPRYLYIGGQDRSDRGVVASGTEVPIEAVNPWNELAYDALRDVARAFNRLRFAEASERAREARDRVNDPALKSYLLALAKIVEGFAAWDRFDYGEAQKQLARDLVNDVRMFWDGKARFDACREQLDRCVARLHDLADTLSDPGAQRNVPTHSVLDDLLANAWRRGYVERRYDDAVSRLYRFVEGMAQRALWDRHGVATGAVPVDRLPAVAPFHTLADRARTAGKAEAKLGLKDAYGLLKAWGDELGVHAARFEEKGDLGILLGSRNQSLLAHGVQPIGRESFERLFAECLKLAGRSEEQLTRFPRLPED